MTTRIPLTAKDGTVHELPDGDGVGVDYVSLNADAAHVAVQGEITWNAEEGTADLGLNGGDSILKIGQETQYRVINNTGSTISKGTLVMAAGTLGNSGKILVAPWDGTAPSKYIMGLAAEDILSATEVLEGTGYVTAFGKLRGIQTNGGNYSESWVDGEILFAGADGGLTKTMPEAPATKTTVAIVIDAHASNGELFVRPTYGSNLAEDELVELGTLADGDVLIWNDTTGRFENGPQSGGGSSVSVGTTPPSTPSVGDLWWDSESGTLYVWYDDGDSEQWVGTAIGAQGATGDTGPAGANGTNGADGDDAYVYIAYASDASGTGFTTTFNSALDYIAIKSTTSPIASPAAGDFTGLWKNYKGATGATGNTGSTGATGPASPRALMIANPTSSENVTLFYTSAALTLSEVRAVVAGSSPSVTYSVLSGSSRATADETHVSSATVTNTTTGTAATLADATITAGRWVWVTTSATSGTVNSFSLSLEY